MLRTEAEPMLQGVLDDWMKALAIVPVLAIYTPSLTRRDGENNIQSLDVLWPPSFALPTQARSDDYELRAPTQDLVLSGQLKDYPALAGWSDAGLIFFTRVSLPVAPHQAITIYQFFYKKPSEVEVQAVAYRTMQYWPKVLPYLIARKSALNGRELNCLEDAFHGASARMTADRFGYSVRVTNWYIKTAMEKLGASTKIEAIKKASLIGHFQA
jgi:DNA-binding CsgD family transcriptional regulator